MRILLYNDIYGPCGGTESYIQVLLKSLQAMGHEVELCAFAERLPSRVKWSQKVKFVRHAQMRLSVLRSSWQKKLNAYQPDLVHCHNNRLYTATIMQELARREIPVISSFHDYDLLDFLHKPQALKAQIKKRQFDLIRQASTYLTAPTHLLHSELQPLHPKVFYLPYFLNNEDWQAPQNSDPEAKRLLYVGRMIGAKGIFRLLKALKHLPDYHLSCIGAGPDLEDFRTALGDSGLAERVSLLGFLKPERLKKMLTQASCLLLPSEYREVFGIVGIEAQAMGLPCIASDVGGISEWCKAGKTGLLVKSGETAALVRAIEYLHSHPALYQGLKSKGLQHQKRYFSAEANMPRLLDLYQSAIREKAAYPAYVKSQKQRLPNRHGYMLEGNCPTDSRRDGLHPHSIAQDGYYTS